jgi:hypothetical protein
MVTLENIEQHTIPFDQFRYKWRFTEEKYNVLPAHHLEQIKPLDKTASKMLNNLTTAMFDGGSRLSPMRFSHIEWVRYVNTLEGEQETKKWLYRLGLPFDREVYASWDSTTAAVTTWKLLVKYWSDFEYADDLAIVDKSLRWALVFYHNDQIEFGTNTKRTAKFAKTNL